MPPTVHALDQRQKIIVAAVTAAVVVLVALLGGFGIHGALSRPYQQITAEDVQPATNSGLGRAVAAMHDLRYLCTEGTSTRQGVRSLVCTGPEGWSVIESTAAGKVTYLTLIGRGAEMTDARAGAVGRALVNGADLSQDAKIAARSVTDGRAEISIGPWGTASAGTEDDHRLVFIGSDRAKFDKPAALGPEAPLAARLAKQSCTTQEKPAPSASAATTTKTSAAAQPSASPSAAPAVRPMLTVCTTSSRLVTTTLTYEKAGDQVTKVTISSSGLFAYGWTHTEAISALRAALTDLGQDATQIGDWVAANASRQGTVDLGPVMVELNTVGTRSVTQVTVTRVP